MTGNDIEWLRMTKNKLAELTTFTKKSFHLITTINFGSVLLLSKWIYDNQIGLIWKSCLNWDQSGVCSFIWGGKILFVKVVEWLKLTRNDLKRCEGQYWHDW